MAGSSGGSTGGGKKKARIEIIPLIDVIFFLLATFVLFTLSLNKTEGIRVANPVVSTGEARDVSNSVTVTVMPDNRLAWNKEENLELNAFIEKLKAYKQTNPDGRIFINGDENAMFNAAIYVFDEARKAGFERIMIETKVKSAARQ